jgi:hypothetical protein
VPRQHKVLTHGQECLFRKVTSVSIHSFVEWLDTFSYVLRPTDMTVKEVDHIRCFAIDEKSETLAKLFPEPPVVAFRRPKSIKDTLVRAAVSRPSSTVGQCKPCGDKRCKPVSSNDGVNLLVFAWWFQQWSIFVLP